MGTAQSVLRPQQHTEIDGLQAGLKGLKGQRNGTRPAASSDHANGLDQQHSRASNGSTAADASKQRGRGKAFLAWAKRQSRQRNTSLQQFLLESAQLQEDASAAAALLPGQETFRAPAPTAATQDAMQDGAQHMVAAQSSTDSSMALQDALAVLTSAQKGPQDNHHQQQQHQQQQQHHQQEEEGQGPAVLAPFQPHNGYVKGAPKPHSHAERVVAADGIQALRRTRDGELESMLRLLCKVFDVETATVALLTGHAVYITAACGALQSCVCPERWGFCGWSFLNSHHELLVVEDMDSDARFSANFFVCDPAFSLKFYVAAPLISSNGHRLGTLCVMGQQARRFDAVKGQVLSNLAEMLVRQLEDKWVAALQSSGACAGLLRATSCYSSSYLVLDLSSRPWRVLHMNEPAVQATGAAWGASNAELACYAEGRREKAPFDGLPLDSLFDVGAARLTWTSPGSWEFTLSGLTLLDNSTTTDNSPNSGSSSSSKQSYTLTCRPASADGLDEDQPFYVGVPGWLALSESNTWGKNYFFARLQPEQQQQQQQQQAPFAGDSVEQLMHLGGAGPCKLGSSGSNAAAEAAAARNSSSDAATNSSGSNAGVIFLPFAGDTGVSASPTDYVWLPRGFAASSSGSNAAPSAAGSGSNGTLLSGSRSLGSFGPSRPAAGSSSIGSSSVRASLDCASSTLSGSSSEQLPKLAPSVASVATSRSGGGGPGSSGGCSGGSGGVSSAVGLLLRGLPIPGLVMGPLLGRGSYGRVYRGLLKGRPVAVKIIDDVASLRLDAAGVPLEVSLTRDLRQPGLMTTLGYAYADAAATPNFSRAGATGAAGAGGKAGRAGGGGGRSGAGTRTCWMLFDFCSKGVLADAVIRGWFRTRANPLTGAPHLRVIGLTALEVAAAMAHLHANNVLHGDLCGGNVMLTASSAASHGFCAKVGDFGLVRTAPAPAAAAAAAAGSGQQQQQLHPVEQRLANNAYGTITHQPPEVLLEGSAAFTAAADVYAWGVLLWEMLTGSRAWAGLSAPCVVVQVAVLRRTLAVPPALPPVLRELLTAALSSDPTARPSFAEIVERLTPFVQQSRATDWEDWQGAVDAAHAAEVAAIRAADAAATAAADSDAPAGGDEAAGEVDVEPSTGVACPTCPLAARACAGASA